MKDKMIFTGLSLAGGLLTTGCVNTQKSEAEVKPNVVFIFTDDQGYGDLSCHGNPILKTPELDKLHAESTRMTNFHVSPFCTPSRASIMTGVYPGRSGAYRTSAGKTFPDASLITVADIFKENGYATGIFGKWHLGENYPFRPQDRGFTHTLWHKCGGVGQISDYWGNDYFDDHYEENGVIKQFKGYCTDVWFDGAIKYIEKQQKEKKPFFVYLPTNAPHGPYYVDKKYAEPYKDKANWSSKAANFYGMIANLDENVGKLRARLKELNLDKNTIFIFATDNGTCQGGKFPTLGSRPTAGYNAGMRGKKSNHYEGGHRVPMFIHWPEGGLDKGHDIETLSAHIDLMPTLVDVCKLKKPANYQTDGKSWAPTIFEDKKDLEDRILHVQFHGGPGNATKFSTWAHSCVMKDKWRLIDGKELYNLNDDIGQARNIYDKHPEIVTELRAAQEKFYPTVEKTLVKPQRIVLGTVHEKSAHLTSQDWYFAKGNPPWNQWSVKKAHRKTGQWMVNVASAGTYKIRFRRWPVELDLPIKSAPKGDKVIDAVKAEIEIADIRKSAAVTATDKYIEFILDLPAGDTELRGTFVDSKGKKFGAFYAEVEKEKAP